MEARNFPLDMMSRCVLRLSTTFTENGRLRDLSSKTAALSVVSGFALARHAEHHRPAESAHVANHALAEFLAH